MNALAMVFVAAVLAAQTSIGQAHDPSDPNPQKSGKQPAKSELEALLEKAMKNNREIIQAEIKVRAAEAEANSVREMIVARVMKHHAEMVAAKAYLDIAKAKLAHLEQARKSGKGASVDAQLEDAKNNLEICKSELAVKRAEHEVTKNILEETRHRLAKLKEIVAKDVNKLAHYELSDAEVAVIKYTGDAAVRKAQVAVAEAVCNDAAAKLTRLQQSRKGGVTDHELEAAQAEVARATADLARLEAVLSGLVGKQGQAPVQAFTPDGKLWLNPDGELRLWDVASGKEAKSLAADSKLSDADKFRKALETPVAVDFGTVSVMDAIRILESKVKGINFHLRDVEGHEFQARLREPVSLAAALQLIEDSTPLRFFIRDYGIVGMIAEYVPPGALFVSDFMKHTQGEAKKK